MARTPNGSTRTRGTLPVLFSVVIVDLIGFGIVIPVLPFLVKDFGASGTQLGLIVAAHPAAQFLFAPVWGRLSDGVGRRPVMLATVAGTAASLLWLGLAESLTTIFVARLLAGAFAANVSVAAAYVSDVTEPSERTRWMGMLGASFAVGFTLGPGIGGVLSRFGHGTPMLFASGLAMLNLVYAVWVLREPPRHEVRQERIGRRELLRNPEILRLCLLNLCFTLGVVQLETIFAYFMSDRFGYDALQVAGILVLMAVVMGGIQGGGMKALSARYAERSMVRVGAVLLAVSVGLVPVMPGVALMLMPLLLSAVGRAVLQPSLISTVSLSVPPENQGAAMGTFQSAASLGRVFGPLAAGALYDVTVGAPFWLASGMFVAVLIVAQRLPLVRGGASAAAG